ncbi:hypothetical protein ACFPYJ_06380 [Paenibacillus solisilvae]|uniref:Uncharacterized protein n=1 Tax=Paenibacillus solisilvae TaxID=2486751 RepID=A0ABW0VVF5_9BACL
MGNDKAVNLLTVDTDRRLDQLLADWAEYARLSPEKEEEIYERIFVVEEDLGYDWWQQLVDGFSFKASNVVPKFAFIYR